MTDASWDDEDFEPGNAGAGAGPVVDKWEGEDEEDVRDNWEEDSEEEGKDEKPAEVAKKPKKSLKEKIAEKEAKRKAELEERRKEQEEAQKKLSPEEIAAEKLRQQKLQEDADFELAKEAFGGVSNDVPSSHGGLDAISLQSKNDFDNFSKALKDKLRDHERSPHYVLFLEDLFRDLTINLEAEDVKKLGSTLNALANEKVKAQKAQAGKGKKKKGGPKVVMDKDVEPVYTEYDDFM